MNQFLFLIFIYFFISYTGHSQNRQQAPSNSTRDEALKDAATYVLASVDEEGQLRIKTINSREIFFQKEPDQVGFDEIRISDDGKAVGWLVLYNNNSTSYPIPLKLKIYSGGEIHVFTGVGLPIWLWHFTAGGKQIAYEQETVHGGWGIHYELREIATERLIAEHNPEYGQNNQPLEIQNNIPEWVVELNDSN